MTAPSSWKDRTAGNTALWERGNHLGDHTNRGLPLELESNHNRDRQ